MQQLNKCKMSWTGPRISKAPDRLQSTVARAKRGQQAGYRFSVHGRHVDVTPELEAYVKDHFNKTLEKLYTAEYIEAEGGVQEVDVRLMNTRAEIKLRPVQTNKALHDTYLRMGELKAEAHGQNVYDSFDKAAENMDRKLHKRPKDSPRRKDVKQIAQNRQPSARGMGRGGK